jgi:hypothetical protein
MTPRGGTIKLRKYFTSSQRLSPRRGGGLRCEIGPPDLLQPGRVAEYFSSKEDIVAAVRAEGWDCCEII